MKFININRLFLILFLSIMLGGCYSFTGGSLPEHIKTMQLRQIADKSGFGNPLYKNELTEKLIGKIQSDNSVELVDGAADSRLTVSIKSIREETATLSGAGTQLEKERKLTISVSVEFYDNIKKTILYSTENLSFSQNYPISGNNQARDEAAIYCIENLCEQILLALVSG